MKTTAMTAYHTDDRDGLQLSSVDIALLPWAFRYYVFEHYRGAAFAIPRQDPTLAAYFSWLDYVMQLPQVRISVTAFFGGQPWQKSGYCGTDAGTVHH
jgi:hypothetical protein